jgi:hypothetical protein
VISWPSDYQFTKEKAAGVDTLSVPVTEPDSLLCADVKTCFQLNSENAVRQPQMRRCLIRTVRDLVIVEEREGS